MAKVRSGMIEVPTIILICAFRYALGRRTAIVSTVAEQIIRHWKRFRDCDRKLINMEIEQAITRGEAGDACDVAEWRKVFSLPVGE